MFFQKIRPGFRHGGDVARKGDSLGIDRKDIAMFQHNQAAPRFQSRAPEEQTRCLKIRSVNCQHIGRRIVFQPEIDLRKIAPEIGLGKIRLTLPNSGGDLNRHRPAQSEQSVHMRVDLLLDDCLLGNPGEQNFVKRPDFQRCESHSRIERPVARQMEKIVSLPHRNPHQPGGGRGSEKRFLPLEQGNVPIPLRVSRFPRLNQLFQRLAISARGIGKRAASTREDSIGTEPRLLR